MALLRKKEQPEPVVLQLTPDCQQALLKLEDDTAVLIELLHELIEAQRAVALQLRAEIDVPVVGEEENGVQPFAEDVPAEAFTADKTTPDPDKPSKGVRESPFARAPRKVQVAWLRGVLGDGMWHSAFGIADRYATDERHRRYMRGAVSGRLRELYEDGEVERRDSPVRGSMYEYRLRAVKP